MDLKIITNKFMKPLHLFRSVWRLIQKRFEALLIYLDDEFIPQQIVSTLSYAFSDSKVTSLPYWKNLI